MHDIWSHVFVFILDDTLNNEQSLDVVQVNQNDTDSIRFDSILLDYKNENIFAFILTNSFYLVNGQGILYQLSSRGKIYLQ